MSDDIRQKVKITKRLYTVAEASVYLGRSVNAVRELIWSGKVPAVRLDRRIQLDIFDLDHLIEKNKNRYD